MDFYSPKLMQFPPAEDRIPGGTDWRGGLLIRSTNWLGDALMTLPAVYRMALHKPHGLKTTVLAPANLAPVWQACPFVDEVVPMNGKRLSDDALARIRTLAPGVAVVLPNSFRSAWEVFRTGIPVRCGRRGRWRGFTLTNRLREWPRGENVGICHQLSYYLQLATLLGDTPLSAECPPLAVDDGLAAEMGMTRGDRWLAMAPGAAFGPAKQWPADYFAEVGRWAASQGRRVVIVGGKGDAAVADAIAGQLPSGTLNLAGKTNLTQLMAVLNEAERVVANDSGAMHLAAALGRDGVALFGSTDPVATGPIGGRWRLLVADAPCRPCFQRTCLLAGKEEYQCLKSLTPQAVIRELQDFDSL